jgi:hypothetical protein
MDNFLWHENCYIGIQKGDVKKMKKLIQKLDKIFVAATFAEAGEFETARDIMREDERPQKVDRITPSRRPRKELRAPGIGR